jgi:CRISPR-associated protein Cas2
MKCTKSIRRRYVIAYDITDERRRRKTARFLLNHGFRLQPSVFEADLTQRELGSVQHQLKAYLTQDDSVVYIALCAECRDKMERYGGSPNPFEDEDLFFV